MNIPENNLAYPILVTLENGSTGSGFFINSGKAQYFVTAGHVIFKDDQNLRCNSAEISCLSPLKTENKTSTFRLNFDKQTPILHKSADVCVFLFATIIAEKPEKGGWAMKYHSSVDVLNANPPETVSVNMNLAIKMFADVEISNNVYLYGYPTSLGLKRAPKIFDYTKPLLRKGIVSNVFPEHKTIILDCAVYYGNSGGPVVQEFPINLTHTEHHVIGVVSKYIPYVQEWINHREKITHEEFMNSGYSIVTSMDSVVELIKTME